MDCGQTDFYPLLESSTLKLLGWLEKNGWESYDSEDFKGLPIIRDLVKGASLPVKFLKLLVYIPAALAPVTFRRILQISPTIPAGALGELATGYLNLSDVMKDKRFVDEAKRCLEWLEANRSSGYSGYGWGLPFDWRSQTVVPKGTPLSHTTAVCARSFIDYYQFTGDKSYIDVAWQACCHISKDLKVKAQPGDAISFTYSPFDDMEVINTNADIAALFARVAAIKQDKQLMELSRKLGLFVLNEQLPDGSWPYFSHNYLGGKLRVDNPHSAMTLSALLDLLLYEDGSELAGKYLNAFKQGLQFYLVNFFGNDGFPCATPMRRYHASTASCGEAISLLSKVGILRSSLGFKFNIDSILSKVILWTVKNMQGRDGGFYYRRYQLLKIGPHSIRGQGLMLRAFGKALKYAVIASSDISK